MKVKCSHCDGANRRQDDCWIYQCQNCLDTGSVEIKPSVPIRVATKQVWYVGTRHYFSATGAARHKARIKIMQRLGGYFQNNSGDYDEAAHDRFKLMRERLARTIKRRLT